METQENLALSAANYENQVGLKFQLYNSLFLTLPLDGIRNTGMFIPILNEYCLNRLAEGHSPKDIIEQFFDEFKEGEDLQSRHNFLFKVLQYVERQVVLVDALEDAAYGKLNNLKTTLHEIELLGDFPKNYKPNITSYGTVDDTNLSQNLKMKIVSRDCVIE